MFAHFIFFSYLCRKKYIAMKLSHRIFVFLLTLFWLSADSFAVPATPNPVLYKLPDGSELTIRLHGDEWVSWAESSDGYTLLINKDGFLEYAMADEFGDLKLSGVRAEEVSERSDAEKRFLSKQDKGLKYSETQKMAMREVSEIRHDALENVVKNFSKNAQQKGITIGHDMRIPVILVDFQDKPFLKTKADFEMFCNQLNLTTTPDGPVTGSIRDWFKACSYGLFDIHFDIYGPYTLSKNIAAYDYKTPGGTNSGGIARELLPIAEADGVDFSIYDGDGDQIMDGIHLIFAGYSQAAGAKAGQSIWPHATNGMSNLKAGGLTIKSVSCSAELRGTSGTNIDYVGTFLHELGHSICGLPDFYDTDGKENGGTSVVLGYWDLMSDGNWADGGRTPSFFSAYSRASVGWIQEVTLNSAQNIILPDPAEEGITYRINTKTPNQYFLVENRQKQGWDAFAPSSGMVIYHVDGNNSGWTKNCVNCNPDRRGLYVKQAAGGAESKNSTRTFDAYPTATNSSFTDGSVPNAKSWSGVNTEKPITQITRHPNRSISFRFMGGMNTYKTKIEILTPVRVSPTDSQESQEVELKLYNAGRDIQTIDIAWTIDGQEQPSLSWSGFFDFNMDTTLNLGSFSLLEEGKRKIECVLNFDQSSDTTVSKTIEVILPSKQKPTLLQEQSLKAWQQNDVLHISGLTPNQAFVIYNVMGIPVHRGVATDDITTIGLDVLPHGTYIIYQNQKTLKIVR